MSSKLHGLVWEGCAHSGMILSRVAVMARLADYSNDEGISWPAVETIQHQIGAKSENTVKAAIKELEQGGWLIKQQRKSGGKNLTNIYKLNVEKIEAWATAAREFYKKSKKQKSRTLPPVCIEGANFEGSNSEGVNIDGSTVEFSQENNPPTIAPDPSLNSTPDPSILKPFMSENSNESTDERNSDRSNDTGIFKHKHPEAAVYTPGGRSWGTQQDLDTAGWIFERVQRINPTAKQPKWAEWANDIRLMREVDSRSDSEIRQLFDFASKHGFWCKNVLSPSKLRVQWDRLYVERANKPFDPFDLSTQDYSIPKGFRGHDENEGYRGFGSPQKHVSDDVETEIPHGFRG